MTICRYALVSGSVQGVGFRAHVAQAARRAGLGGYARNLADGRVEVLLCGESPAVAEAEKEVACGPAAARVTDVVWEDRVCEKREASETG